MKLQQIQESLINEGIIENPTGVLTDVMAGFEILKDKENKTAIEMELLRETAIQISKFNFHGKASEALDLLLSLPIPQSENEVNN